MANTHNALTRDIIIEKCKKENFNEIKNINLWGSELEDMTIIRQLPNIEVVSLSVNKINTLQHFSYCPKIQELYLRKNQIADLKEIRHLQNLKNLRVLWLSDNPCSNEQHYRAFIIKMIPQLTKIDSHEITDDERSKANKINFDQYMGSLSKNPSNRNILQQNLMSQNNAKQSKSPFKSNENLGGQASNQVSQTKLESLRSNNDHSQNSGYSNPVKRIQNMQQNRQQNSQSAHAARNSGSNFPSSNQIHNQSVTNNSRSHQQITNENQNANHSHNNSVSNNTHRNENILCAVLALIKELNENELELIKRDIEKKLSLQQQKNKH